MKQATGDGAQRVVERVLGGALAALVFAVAIIQPEVANAAHGGGGFGGFRGGGFHHGFGRFRGGFGFGGIYAPYWWGHLTGLVRFVSQLFARRSAAIQIYPFGEGGASSFGGCVACGLMISPQRWPASRSASTKNSKPNEDQRKRFIETARERGC